MNQHKPATVILTGGIASGKTAVSDLFAQLGVSVVDTDLIAREVVMPGHIGLKRIVSRFSENILHTDGTLDRAALKNLIFSDKQAKNDLESITHPLIRTRVMQMLDNCSARYSILVVPLYIETGKHYNADHIIVVDVPVETQLKRLLLREHIDKELALQIINQQTSREERLAVADDVITNSGSFEQLEQQVHIIHKKLLQIFPQH